MSSHHPPLTCAQFKSILDELGFEPRAQRSGTSHEQWVKVVNGKLFKVTVDCPKAPFSPDLISSMARQPGVSKADLYKIHFQKSQSDVAAPTATANFRYEHREHPGQPGYWCVWDKQDDCLAFNGSLSFLTEHVAIERASKLNV